MIPSAEVIATEILRHTRLKQVEENGTGLVSEQWREHKNEADIVKDTGLRSESWMTMKGKYTAPFVRKLVTALPLRQDSVHGFYAKRSSGTF